MFVILWEFEVKPGFQECFEKAYGPKGAWAQLFQSDPHFRGTQLLRDPSRALCYFTLDFWDSETAFQSFLLEHRAPYDELERVTETFTCKERRIGSFIMNP